MGTCGLSVAQLHDAQTSALVWGRVLCEHLCTCVLSIVHVLSIGGIRMLVQSVPYYPGH